MLPPLTEGLETDPTDPTRPIPDGQRRRLLPSSLLRLLVSALGDVMPRMPLIE